MGKGIFGGGGIYSITYNLPYWFYKFIKKHPMEEISDTAKLRLAMIEFYYQVKDVQLFQKHLKFQERLSINGFIDMRNPAESFLPLKIKAKLLTAKELLS